MIPSYLISYDLIKTKDYDKLFEGIRSISNGNCQLLGSVWIIGHNGSATQIRETLKSFIDADDKLLVLKLTGEGAWRNLGESKSEWLKSNL